MARLLLSPAARDDLSEIRRFIARDDAVGAKSFIEEIRAHCRRLAEQPTMHPILADIDPRVRKAVHGAYLIFYEDANDGILILRVLHGARDVRALPLRGD